MNKFLSSLLSLLLFCTCSLAQSLSGVVTDSSGHEAIYGAIVSIPQLKLAATADAKGKYKISPLPNGTYDVEVMMLGYTPQYKQVTVNGDMTLNFDLAVSSSAIGEVVITALGNVTSTQRSPVPVSVVTHDMMLRATSTNAIDAIAYQPGVTEITEGPCISKPEINGLGYNRVLTLFDGEKQEDFQWGDEHGILIDPYAIYDAEIIRGPASLQYGANANAGVVSFKSEPVAESGTIQGSVLGEYQTNNGMMGTSLNVGGNNNGFIWNLRGSIEGAHCYSDPKDGYVWGTAFVQQNARGTIGIKKKWGSSRLSFSVLHRQVELPDGNRDSTGRFAFDVPQNGQVYPDRSNYFSYDPNIAAYQVLDHYTLWWQNSFNVGKGKLDLDLGYSQSHRQEIDTGTVADFNFKVQDIPYSFKYHQSWSNGLKLTAGINGMYEFNRNAPPPPAPYIRYSEVNNYNDFDLGGFAILQWDYKDLTLSGGLRFDVRDIMAPSQYILNFGTTQQQNVPEGTPGAYTQYLYFHNIYSSPSGTIGASYQLPKNNYLKLNFARSYRAPSPEELSANGVNSGANSYIIGNTHLKAETGYEVDLAWGYNGRDISFEANGFLNYINNFIFQDRLASVFGGDSVQQGTPVFQYLSNNAYITGVTGYFKIHPAVAKWIEIDNGFTYINTYLTHQTDSTQHIPLTPAPRLTSEVRFNIPTGRSILSGTYFQFGLEHDWAQNNIYSALYTELPSEAYTIYNAGIGTNFVNKNTRRVICSLFINCTNLTNLAYASHLSHNAYFLASGGEPVVTTQLNQGIYNMGRNVGFKLLIPFGGFKISNKQKEVGEYD